MSPLATVLLAAAALCGLFPPALGYSRYSTLLTNEKASVTAADARAGWVSIYYDPTGQWSAFSVNMDFASGDVANLSITFPTTPATGLSYAMANNTRTTSSQCWGQFPGTPVGARFSVDVVFSGTTGKSTYSGTVGSTPTWTMGAFGNDDKVDTTVYEGQRGELMAVRSQLYSNGTAYWLRVSYGENGFPLTAVGKTPLISYPPQSVTPTPLLSSAGVGSLAALPMVWTRNISASQAGMTYEIPLTIAGVAAYYSRRLTVTLAYGVASSRVWVPAAGGNDNVGLNANLYEGMMSSRNTANPSPAAGWSEIHNVSLNIDGTVTFNYNVVAWGVSNTSTFTYLDYKQTAIAQFTSAVATTRTANSISWAGSGTYFVNGSAFWMGQLFYKTRVVIHSGMDATVASSVFLMSPPQNEMFPLPAPAGATVSAYLVSSQSSLPRPGAIMFALASPSQGRYAISIVFPRSWMSLALANSSTLRLNINAPPTPPQQLQDYPTGQMMVSGTAPTVVLQNVLALQLDLRRSTSSLAKGQFVAAPVITRGAGTSAPAPTTAVGLTDVTKFISLMDTSNLPKVTAGGGAFGRFTWDTSLPGRPRVYFKLMFKVGTPPTSMGIFQQVGSLPLPIAQVVLNFDIVHGVADGYIDVPSTTLLLPLQRGQVSLEVYDASLTPILAGSVVADDVIHTASQAYNAEVVAVAAETTSRYACASRAGYNPAAKREAVIVQCSANATFSAAVVSFADENQVVTIASLTRADSVGPTVYGAQVVYPKYAYDNVLTGITSVTVTLSTGVVAGRFLAPIQKLSANLVGLSYGSGSTATSAGYAVIETNHDLMLGITVIMGGLQSDITKAVLQNADRSWTYDLTSSFDGPICDASFTWPYFNFVHELDQGQISLNISTASSPNGAVRGNFWPRALPLAVFNNEPIELMSALSAQQANPSAPVRLGLGGYASFYIVPPSVHNPSEEVPYYNVIGSVSVASLDKLQPPDIVKSAQVFGPYVPGTWRRPLLTFSLTSNTGGIQLFNLSAWDARELMSANVSVSSFKYSRLVGGLVYVRPRSLYALPNGYEAQKDVTAAGIAQGYLDHFGTFHYQINMAGFTSTVTSVAALQRATLVSPIVTVWELLTEFTTSVATGEQRPPIPVIMAGMNNQLYIAATVTGTTTPTIVGTLGLGLGGNFGKIHISGVLVPTGPARFSGYAAVTFAPTDTYMTAVINTDLSSTCQVLRIVDNSNTVYYESNITTGTYSSSINAKIGNWSAAAKNMLTWGQMTVQALDMNGVPVLSAPLAINAREFEAILSPTIPGPSSGYVQFSLDSKGSLVYKAWITGLIGLTIPPTIRLDAGMPGAQVFAQLDKIWMTEKDYGSYYAEGRILLSDYTSNTEPFQFHQLYYSAKVSVYSVGSLMLRGDIGAVRFDDVGESADMGVLMSQSQMVPRPSPSLAGGAGILEFQEDGSLHFHIEVVNPTSAITSAYIAGPSPRLKSGNMIFDLLPYLNGHVIHGFYTTIDQAGVTAILAGHYYVVVGTVNNPAGEVRGQIFVKSRTYSDILKPTGGVSNAGGVARFELDSFGMMHAEIIYSVGNALSTYGGNISSIVLSNVQPNFPANQFSSDISSFIGHSSVIRGSWPATAKQIYALAHRSLNVAVGACASCTPILSGQPSNFQKAILKNGPPVIYHALLSGSWRPSGSTKATGFVYAALDTKNDLHYQIKLNGIQSTVTSILVLNGTGQAQYAFPIANLDQGFGWLEGVIPAVTTAQQNEINQAQWAILVVTSSNPFGELLGLIVLHQHTEAAMLSSSVSKPTGGAAWSTLSVDFSGRMRVLHDIRGLSGPLTQATFADKQTTPVGASLLRNILMADEIQSVYGQSPAWYPLLSRGELQLQLGTQAVPGGELQGAMAPTVTPQDLEYRALMSGFNVGTIDGTVPAAKTSAVGSAAFFFDGTNIRYNIVTRGLSGPPTKFAMYTASPGYVSTTPWVYDFTDSFDGTRANGIIVNPTADMKMAIANTTAYILISTAKFPAGELRGNLGLEVRDVSILATQMDSMKTAPITGYLVGCPCTMIQDGLFCQVLSNNNTGVITGIYLEDDTGKRIADLTFIYQYLGNSFFHPLTVAEVQLIYAGRFYITVATARNPAGELRGQVVVNRFYFTDHHTARYQALFTNPSVRGGGYLLMNKASGTWYDYKGYIRGGAASSCTLSNPASPAGTTLAQLSINGPEIKGSVSLLDSTFDSRIVIQCLVGASTWTGDVVLVTERFLSLLNGGGVSGSPQSTASAGILYMETDINRNLIYTGRTSNLSTASFGSMQIIFSDGPQFFTANASGSNGQIPLSQSKYINEIYAMNTTVDIRPPSGAAGFAPILLAGRVFPSFPGQEVRNYLLGKRSQTDQLSFAVTPAFVQSPLPSNFQGQGGIIQMFYTRSLWQLNIDLHLGGLASSLVRCGFWNSQTGTQVIDLMPLLGNGVYNGFIITYLRVYLNRAQLDLFKENLVYFRADSTAQNKMLGKVGSLISNEMVNAQSTSLYADGSIMEGMPNAYVMLIPDSFAFPAPSIQTYQFVSGNTLGSTGVGASVFRALSNGTLYTGLNSSMVPDYETKTFMTVVLNLWVGGRAYIQANLYVTIIDINDNYPMFTRAPNATVNEDVGTTPDAAVLTTVEVSDRDSPKYGAPIVSILRATNALGADRTSYFTVKQPGPGRPAGIYRAKVLDFDMPGNDWYRLDLQAIDGTPAVSDRKTVNTTIYIKLLDLNDNRPTFSAPFYLTKPEETLAVGSVILSVTAMDADSTTNRQLRYTSQPTDGSPAGQFTVTTLKQGDWYVGQLKVNAPLDFETVRNYNLSLTATDMGRVALSRSVPVYIEVVNQPFKLAITFPPPFLTVYNTTRRGNFANNNRVLFNFMTNNEDGITSVPFMCRVLTLRSACRYSRDSIGACSRTCGTGTRSVTLSVVQVAFPSDTSCVAKTITEPCQDRLCPMAPASPPPRRVRRMIPCGQDLYCEKLDLSDLVQNPFLPCTSGGAVSSATGTFVQPDPADGDYIFQLRANVSIVHSGSGQSFSGYTNSSVVYTIDTQHPTTTIAPGFPPRNNYTCPDIDFATTEPVQFWCKLEFTGETRNYTKCASPFNPCKQPPAYGYSRLWRNGNYKFSVMAVDRAQNAEAFAKTLTYELDTYRPLVGLVDFPPRLNRVSALRFEIITNDTEATATCWVNGAVFPCSASAFTVTGMQGENHFTMIAVDPAGNVAPYVDYLFFIDSAPPVVQLADLNDNVFDKRENAVLHIQSNELLDDMRCRTTSYPNADNYTSKLEECCDEAFSSAASKAENCLAACKDFSGDDGANLDRTVCRSYLRAYSECLENKTMAFMNSGVSGGNRLTCDVDSAYPTQPSCRNGSYPIGTRTRQNGFYIFQVKYRDLIGNTACYQAAFVYEKRYVSQEQDANDIIEQQTCPGDGLTYIIFVAAGGGALFIAFVVCLSYYCCCMDRGNPYRKPMSVGPATGAAPFGGPVGQGLEVDNQMFDDSRYGGVQDKAGLIGSMEIGEEDPPEADYEALQIN